MWSHRLCSPPSAANTIYGSTSTERVDASGGGGSGAGDYGDRLQASLDVPLNGFAQEIDAHTEGLVNGDESNGIVTEAEERGGFGGGHVRFNGAVEDAAANACLVGGQFGFTGHAEAHEVCR